MAWQTLPVEVAPVLPGTVPVLRWFAAERGFAGATHSRLTTLEAWTGSMHVKWDAQGLVPVIAQEVGSNDVLMFAFMNREALARTAELGEAVYWSRSRGRLWHKGEESGHIQKVHEIAPGLRQRRGAAEGRRSSATRARRSPATPGATPASSSSTRTAPGRPSSRS